ncbi:MAG: leucine-rich repeat domain-containing protein [Saprospiraceae bacterium]|nr:leucine-rich repeat domain-containing protein [Saprospiraceae bacterium]
MNNLCTKSVLKLFFVVTLIFSFYTEGVSQCACTDCRCSDSLELVKLYNATDGANWMNKWNLSQPLTTWYEVTLTNERVTKLFLLANKLKGVLPDFRLPKLSSLILNSNQLTGALPNLNMPNLQYLDLGNNQLSGSIPNFNLANLQYLDLQNNQLNGCIPKEIKTNCPLITAVRGFVNRNPNLTTQSWSNYWNNGEGACTVIPTNEVAKQDNWLIYPNPTHDFLAIKGLNKEAKVLIYNNLGVLLIDAHVKDGAVKVSSLCHGVYHIRIMSEEQEKSFIFLKE